MEKGQLFSLDFLISLVAATLAIGLLIQTIEVQAYSQKEEELYAELKHVGETAGNLLVSSPEIVCELTDGSVTVISSLNNCLPWINEARITKENMGIPSEFKCSLEKISGSQDLHPNSYDCKDNSSSAKNIAFAERKVVVLMGTGNSPEITKAEFEDCLRQQATCKLRDTVVRLKVWKE